MPKTVSVYALDPLRDLRHRDSRAAPDCADWLAFLELEEKAPRTLDAYEKAVAMLLRAFPDKAITDFADSDVNHVLRLVPQPSRRAIRVRLSSFFRWATLMDRIERNPMDRVPRIRDSRQLVYDVYSEAEIALLTGLPHPDGALMRVLIDTGIRKGEARRLQWRHVLMETLELVVYESKGRKSRLVPLSLDCYNALEDLERLEGLNPDDFLWYGLAGGRRKQIDHSKGVGEARFHNWYAGCVRRAGVRYRKPHMTRHTYATMMLRAGIRLERISAYMGHESVETTFNTYVHLDLRDARKDMELLDQSRQAVS